MYLAFRPDGRATQEFAVAEMEACVRDVRKWMTQDKLKLNDKKTEIMVIGTEAQLKKVNITNWVIGKSAVAPSQNPIRNLGSWFDSNLKMDTQITKTCKAGFFYLHNLSRIRRHLDQESTEKLIHAFVTSRLDYCNSLLYGLPDCRLLKLQRVQNAVSEHLSSVISPPY